MQVVYMVHCVITLFLNTHVIVIKFLTYKENVAVHSTNIGANVPRYSNHYVTHLTDGQLNECHMMVQELKKKRVWLRMYKTALVYKVFIANNPDKLDELTDFDIKIGMQILEFHNAILLY